MRAVSPWQSASSPRPSPPFRTEEGDGGHELSQRLIADRLCLGWQLPDPLQPELRSGKRQHRLPARRDEEDAARRKRRDKQFVRLPPSARPDAARNGQGARSTRRLDPGELRRSRSVLAVCSFMEVVGRMAPHGADTGSHPIAERAALQRRRPLELISGIAAAFLANRPAVCGPFWQWISPPVVSSRAGDTADSADIVDGAGFWKSRNGVNTPLGKHPIERSRRIPLRWRPEKQNAFQNRQFKKHATVSASHKHKLRPNLRTHECSHPTTSAKCPRSTIRGFTSE